MRPQPATPANQRLPLPEPRHEHRRHRIAGVDLRGLNVAHFNDVLHELNPDAPHLDADAIASVARWLAAQTDAQANALLQARLGRLHELDVLLNDEVWPVDPALRSRVEKMLAYVAASEDLIDDSLPFIGQLDDALLVELAWPMVADELEDYRDFCRFREESGHLYAGNPSRDDWLRTRLEEGALWEQLHRVRDTRYADPNWIREGLHVV